MSKSNFSIEMLKTITLNKNDQEIVDSYHLGKIKDSEMKAVIQKGISIMRINNQMANFKGFRIEGILPQEISNEIIFFSNMPGENDDELILEVDHHNSDHSADMMNDAELQAHDAGHEEQCKIKGKQVSNNKGKKNH